MTTVLEYKKLDLRLGRVVEDHDYTVEEGEELGRHIIAEVYTNRSDIITNREMMEKILDEACKAGNLTVLEKSFYEFTPEGLSGMYFLAESHISFHSWPEHGYIALDIYTCGGDGWKAFKTILDKIEAKEVYYAYLRRGKPNVLPGKRK
jgi:S-adenosylmethionine decarboxylase